jgi:hypothetical protein
MSDNNGSEASAISLVPYLAHFVLNYTFLALLVPLVINLLPIQVESMSVIVMMGAVPSTMRRFVQQHNRVMVRSERLRFAAFGAVLAHFDTTFLVPAIQVLFGADFNAATGDWMMYRQVISAVLVTLLFSLMYFAGLVFAIALHRKWGVKNPNTKMSA